MVENRFTLLVKRDSLFTGNEIDSSVETGFALYSTGFTLAKKSATRLRFLNDAFSSEHPGIDGPCPRPEHCYSSAHRSQKSLTPRLPDARKHGPERTNEHCAASDRRPQTGTQQQPGSALHRSPE